MLSASINTLGLLPGCYRARFLESGTITEAVLVPADLQRARVVYAANSVRGLTRCKPAYGMGYSPATSPARHKVID